MTIRYGTYTDPSLVDANNMPIELHIAVGFSGIPSRAHPGPDVNLARARAASEAEWIDGQSAQHGEDYEPELADGATRERDDAIPDEYKIWNINRDKKGLFVVVAPKDPNASITTFPDKDAALDSFSRPFNV